MYDHEKILLGILVALLSLIGVLVWLGVLAEDAISGQRKPGEKILKALGLEESTVYVTKRR